MSRVWLAVRRYTAIALLIGSYGLAVLLPFVLAAYLYYPKFDSIEEWMYLYGLNRFWPMVHWVLFIIPWVVAGFAAFLFERHLAERFGNWLGLVLRLPLPDHETANDNDSNT